MRPSKEAEALAWRKSLRAEDKGEEEKRLKRAVADVMDGGVTVTLASSSRKVSRDRLTAALEAAGWQSRVTSPSPRRRTFGNGRRHGTQLPQRQDDNQS